MIFSSFCSWLAMQLSSAFRALYRPGWPHALARLYGKRGRREIRNLYSTARCCGIIGSPLWHTVGERHNSRCNTHSPTRECSDQGKLTAEGSECWVVCWFDP
ncbi:hypothetical protein HOY80DRAFT_711259 [Tuber brumale]|nr:hypothetical protein HOY80DRAFT_711259 [Tuber brumale]